MRKYLLFFIVLIFSSCAIVPRLLSVKPTGFTYKIDGSYTGLDTIININGYYLGPKRGNMSNGLSFMFYDNGIMCQSATSPIKVYVEAEFNAFWGSYIIDGDSIRGQIIYDLGWGDILRTGNFLFVIKDNNKLALIEDKSSDELIFHSLNDARTDSESNPWLKKKWFWKKGTKKKSD